MKVNPRFPGVVVCLLAAGLLFPPVSHCRLANDHQQAPDHSANGQGEAFQKGLNALKENRLEAALVEITAAERGDPDDPRIHNFRGIVLARLGQNTEAAAEYQEAIRLDPRMEDAYRNLGFLEWTDHNLERAREALVRAVELSPKDSFAHYYLGRVQLDRQVYAEAFRELELSDVLWPAEPGFLMQAAAGYLTLGRQDEARKTLHQLTTLSLLDAQSVRVAALLLAVHENDSAIGLLQKLLDRHAAELAPWAQFDLALASLFAGRYEKAADQAENYINVLRPAGSESAQIVPAWTLAGIAYARLGQGDRAVDALRRAAALAPYREEHWLNLTRELMELSRYAEAISAVQDGLATNPKSYALHLRLGAADLSAGHYAEAETAFRRLVEAGDPLPTSYIGLAQVLLRTGRAEEAASELSAAQQKLGATFLISYFQGLSLERAGKRPQAITALDEAIRLNPNSAEARLELGKTELALGRVKEAIVELEEALHLSPGNVQAGRLLSQAYQRAGDAQRAAKYADNATEAPPAAEGDLLGDFVLPDWQIPEESKKGEVSTPKGTF
jgi:tetratricopeptide (TPR) repeat protein